MTYLAPLQELKPKPVQAEEEMVAAAVVQQNVYYALVPSEIQSKTSW
jgi:hypothetical protein